MNIKNSKETILNQALTIFGRLGFHKTTMADIANASKRGRRTIYTYFKNKEEVYEAVVAREIDKVLEEIQTKIESKEKATEKLSVYIESRLFAIIELTKHYDALRIAYVNNYQWVEKIRARLDEQEKEIIHNILQLGVSNDDLSIDDINAKTINLAYIIQGIEFILIKENDETITKNQIKDVQHTILNGLIKN